MAKIIGQDESLKSLRTELNKRNIYRFNSVGDINRFNREFTNEKQNILKSHEDILNEEIIQKTNRIIENENKLEFNPPIYNKKTQDRIYSIQLDHLLVSKSGIFILETKNWSKRSIDSLDLRSPVDQIIRTSYALFRVVNSKIQLNKHHWGTKQIPIRNIIVMINEKPKNEFKYVKIRQLKELNNYLEYFDPIFSQKEVDSIVSYLVEK